MNRVATQPSSAQGFVGSVDAPEREVSPTRPLVATLPRASQRIQRNTKLLLEVFRSSDMVVALAVLFAVFLLDNARHLHVGVDDFLTVRITLKNVLLLGGFVFLWPASFSAFGLYNTDWLRTMGQEALRVAAAAACGSGFLLLFPLTSTGGAFRLQVVAYFWPAAVAATLILRHLLRWLMAASASSVPAQIIIVGTGPRALKLQQNLLADRHRCCEVAGFVDVQREGMLPETDRQMLGTVAELEEILMRRVVDKVLIALPIKSCYAEIQRVINICERVGVESHYLADVFQSSLQAPRYEHTAHTPVIAMKVVSDDLRVVIKRTVDVVAAGLGLIALAPVLLAIALAIKLTSPGPALFAQKRYGRGRRLFDMYKFRTMVPEAEALQLSLEHLNEVRGPVFKIKNDPRITPIGRFLRRTSLDELPQLINVLKGEMSLVGPRPLPTRDVHLFSEAWLMRRFSVPPGLTCLWQISGRSNLDFDNWVALDLQYIDRWSLRLDFLILLRTIPAVLKGTGAS